MNEFDKSWCSVVSRSVYGTVCCDLGDSWETGSPESGRFQVDNRVLEVTVVAIYRLLRTGRDHCKYSGSSAKYETEVICFELLQIIYDRSVQNVRL